MLLRSTILLWNSSLYEAQHPCKTQCLCEAQHPCKMQYLCETNYSRSGEPLMNNISPDIGEALKRIRSDMNLSLDSAAKLTGVSKAMLGQIERKESIPTISTLWKISTGLKVSISTFISVPSIAHDLICIDDIIPVEEEEGEMLLYNIFPFNPISGFDYLQIHLKPGCCHASFPHANVATEYIVVTQGILEMTINDEKILLKEGYALSFRGNSVHAYANPTKTLTIFQNIIQYI